MHPLQDSDPQNSPVIIPRKNVEVNPAWTETGSDNKPQPNFGRRKSWQAKYLIGHDGVVSDAGDTPDDSMRCTEITTPESTQLGRTSSKEPVEETTQSKHKIVIKGDRCERWIVLLLISLALVGDFYCYDNPSAVKVTKSLAEPI